MVQRFRRKMRLHLQGTRVPMRELQILACNLDVTKYVTPYYNVSDYVA
jgi:hypothetical protein